MNVSSRAPFYDLFKLIVAIILLLIFLWIWMRPTQTRPLELLPATLTSPLISPSTTLIMNPTVVPASSTSVPPTSTATPFLTETPSPTFTVPPSPTESLVPEVLPTPIVEIPAETNICEAISRSQLQVGMKANIVRYLNFRSSPGILNNWLRTNIPGTQVEVVGGPACTRYKNGGAYRWWQIKLPDGQIGWSAEASAFGKFYFMEPVR